MNTSETPKFLNESHHMKNIGILIIAFCASISTSFAGEPPANSDVALEESFDRAELGEGWQINKGE
jgi:hypothetical protein